jgi:tetratricopeptide (TPR) repeat protein
MNRKLLSFFVLLIWALSTLACLPGDLLGGKKAAQPTPTEISKPTAVAPTAPPVATPTPSADDHIDRGVEYVEQGEYDEAVAEFQAAIELDPDDAGAHRNLGTAYLEQGKYEEAAAAYEKAIELDPDFGEAYGDLAGAYFNLGKLAEAVAAGEKGIELDPNYAMAYNNLGVVYGVQGNLDRAITLLRQAIQVDPDCADAHYNLGFAYESLGQAEEAIAEYQEAIRADADYTNAYENLGSVYARLGQLDEAIAWWKKTLEIEPDRASTHQNLGMAYAEQGKAEEAIVEFETYLQLQPDAPDRAAVEEEIAKLKEQAAAPGAEYRNAAGGYSLRYPEGWYYTEDEAQVIFAESEEALEAAPEEAPMVILIAGPLSEIAESLNLEEITDPVVALKAMAKNLEAEIGEVETGKVADYPAALTAISGTFEGVSYQGGLAVVLVEERVVYGVALAPPDQWESFRPTFVTMVNSLSFFEPTAAEEQPATPTSAPSTATPKPTVAQGPPCFDTRFERIEDSGGALQEVRGHVYDLNEQPVKGAVVEAYVKGYWSQVNKQALTTDDGGFLFPSMEGSTDHEYILRIIGMPDGTPAYNTWEETYTFKFETTHDRAVVFIYQIPFQDGLCHPPNEVQ